MLAALALALTLVPAASAAAPENTSPISIGDCCAPQPATPYGIPLTVAGMTGNVTKVTLGITGLTHGASSDLDILLVGPTNQSVLVLSDTGLSATGANLVFDDTGATPVNGIPLASGTYKPTNNAEDCPGAGDTFPAPAPAGAPASTLASFNGLAANGTWTVYVVDDCEVD